MAYDACCNNMEYTVCMKAIVNTVLVLLVLGAGVWWYGARAGWFVNHSPTNPPTAEELERIEEIERSSSQIAPNAKPGAGVLPSGGTPRTQEPAAPQATSATATGTQLLP